MIRMKCSYALLVSLPILFGLTGGRPVSPDCGIQCVGSLPQCNLPRLFGFPKCTTQLDNCKFNKPRPFRPGVIMLGEPECY
ncbi:hypothetical protein AWC38_SpisGene7091 [Stylophora pistillata]|uniref:Uncharacterized protein n=1 Tax=Stylophora pistillata TaxID=50429 RepID=A0A2B4SEB2_STYPI|nr:hypothetical protein AWC38_SpisGene7091 [Stylophora pistillata]